MRIALCDDHKTITRELEKMIQKFHESHQLSCDLAHFTNPSRLYSHMQSEPIDVVFMDLKFENAAEDGIDWSKKILQLSPHTIIIILTAYEARYKEGYAVRAFRFMTKPIEEKELFENLEACLEELELNRSISIPRHGIPQEILLSDICYISAQSGGSELWTRTDMYPCEESLLQWEQRLPASIFIRCHKKYLVNLQSVIQLDNHMLTLAGGEKVPVSRRKWKALQIAYMKYDIRGHHLL